MNKLLKSYGFKNHSEYYDMILESLINGQFTQAKEQFNKLPKTYNKEFLRYSFENYTDFSQVLNHLV